MVCPNCHINNMDGARYCANCGANLMAGPAPPPVGPPPYGQYGYTYAPYNVYSPYPRKDPVITAILALVVGILGLMGIGHIYVGKVVKGILILVVGIVLWAVSLLSFFLGFLALNAGYWALGIAALVGLFVLLVWQTYDAYVLANEYNRGVQQTGSPPW